MLNYILENCTYYHIFQSIWVISFSTLFITLHFMSKYSFEFSYYFSVMISTIFTFGLLLYILFIMLYAIVDIYSKLCSFCILAYKYGLSDASNERYNQFLIENDKIEK